MLYQKLSQTGILDKPRLSTRIICNRQDNNSSGAFTLIEMAVCLVILGIIASVTILSLNGRRSLSRADEAVSRLVSFEKRARQSTQRHAHRCQLVFEVGGNKVNRINTISKNHEVRSLILPGQWKINHLYIREMDVLKTSSKTQYSKLHSGHVAINVGIDGRSLDYAIEIANSHDSSQWIYFAGFTGEPINLDDEEQVRALFKATTSSDAS